MHVVSPSVWHSSVVYVVRHVVPGKLVNKTPCLYLCSFPFVVAALLLVGRLASLAWILTYSTVMIQIQTRSLIHQFSLYTQEVLRYTGKLGNKTLCRFLRHHCRISRAKVVNLPTNSNVATTKGKTKIFDKVSYFPRWLLCWVVQPLDRAGPSP